MCNIYDDPVYYVYYFLREEDDSIGKAGTPYYVGKGKGNRITRPRKQGVPTNPSYRVKIAENLTELQAHCIEKIHIALWGRYDLGQGILLNFTDGGDGVSGRRNSMETRLKMSLSAKKRMADPKAKAMVRASNSNREITESTRKKMGRSMRGKNHSIESKKSMSIAQKQKWRKISTEEYQRICEIRKSHRHSDETKAKMSALAKAREAKKRERKSLFNQDKDDNERI